MDTRKRMKNYEILTNLSGVSGYEKNVRKYMKEEITKYADAVVQDKLGSIFGIKYGDQKGPIIMIAGHMDEVGAIVVGITDKGFLKMQAIGGLVPEVFLSQNMQVEIAEGKFIQGIIGATPPHSSTEGDKKLAFSDLLLDIGADSKEHAEELGIKIGQQITPMNQYYVTADGKKIVSKAWDNRFGAGMALEILKEIHKMDHPNVVVAGATVQEEVGLRGATTASQMVKPDLFIALDVSPVGDFMKEGHPKAFGKLGGGFLVRFYDPRAIMHNGLRIYFEKIAKKYKINHQDFLSFGGTDAAAAQYTNGGTLATTIGLPGRYIHSNAAMIHVDDVDAVKKMVLSIIKNLDRKTLEEIKNNV